MICLVCGGERLRVMSTIKRGSSADIRHVWCDTCSQQYLTRTEISEVIVMNPSKLKAEHVTIAEFLKRWLPTITGRAA